MNGLDSIQKNYEQWADSDKVKGMTEEERIRSLSRLAILNEENVRQILSEVIWL